MEVCSSSIRTARRSASQPPGGPSKTPAHAVPQWGQRASLVRCQPCMVHQSRSISGAPYAWHTVVPPVTSWTSPVYACRTPLSIPIRRTRVSVAGGVCREVAARAARPATAPAAEKSPPPPPLPLRSPPRPWPAASLTITSRPPTPSASRAPARRSCCAPPVPTRRAGA